MGSGSNSKPVWTDVTVPFHGFGTHLRVIGIACLLGAPALVAAGDLGWVDLDFSHPEVAVGVPGLLIAGLAGLFFRYETILDRQSGTATQWWGFVRPFKSEVYSLDDFELVSFEEPLIHVRRNPQHRFEIWLRGKNHALKLSGGRSRTQMQQWAQKIASHLKMGLRTPADD